MASTSDEFVEQFSNLKIDEKIIEPGVNKSAPSKKISQASIGKYSTKSETLDLSFNLSDCDEENEETPF